MQRMGARAARRAAAATRRNPLTGLNPLQPMSGATANSAQRRSVAIPLRGSIPCNTGACLGHQLAQRRSRNPLTGLNPLQRPGAHHRGAAAPRVAIPLRGSIPATNLKGGESHGSLENVAIPLRGSIPCNTKEDVGEGDSLKGRNPLTGLNPLQREEAQGAGVHPHLSQSPYGAQSLATYEAGRPLHPYLSSQSPYGAQSLATPLRVPRVRGRRGSVAIPLRGSIPCNMN